MLVHFRDSTRMHMPKPLMPKDVQLVFRKSVNALNSIIVTGTDRTGNLGSQFLNNFGLHTFIIIDVFRHLK